MNGRTILLSVAGLFLLGGGAFMFYRTSQSGIDKIKEHEALRLEPYRDVAGILTIGYGHVLINGEYWESITEEFAEELLRQDLAIAESAVSDYVEVGITQNQYDALVSFTFNVGVNAFHDSTLLRKLNAGDPSTANEFERWKYAGGQVVAGLLARRKREKALFLA